MNIGLKLKSARIKANLTQEEVADALGVSRQTISNWENEKTYPDIISVLKMSDLYRISLDLLLKGEDEMSNYFDYLENSTNTVKSNNRKAITILVSAYFAIWAFAIMVFWLFTSGSDAMGYSLVYLWILLPITTFMFSLIIANNDYFGKWKWLSAPAFGVMYMLADYATFSAANMTSFDKFNVPNFWMIIAGAIISAIGLTIGYTSRRIKKHRSKI